MSKYQMDGMDKMSEERLTYAMYAMIKNTIATSH